MKEIETKVKWKKEFDTETTDYYKAREKAMEMLNNDLTISRFELIQKRTTKHWHIIFIYRLKITVDN